VLVGQDGVSCRAVEVASARSTRATGKAIAMILRRIIEHLKLQHWTAVVIELLIVILGVFIGTQVSNWNLERTTNRQAAEFTVHLKEDLREEDWGYQMMIQYSRVVLENAERTVQALDGAAP